MVELRIGSEENAKYLTHLTMDVEFGGTCSMQEDRKHILDFISGA